MPDTTDLSSFDATATNNRMAYADAPGSAPQKASDASTLSAFDAAAGNSRTAYGAPEKQADAQEGGITRLGKAFSAGVAGLPEAANAAVNLPFAGAEWAANKLLPKNAANAVSGALEGPQALQRASGAVQRAAPDYIPFERKREQMAAFQPQGLAENMAYGAGSAIPFALTGGAGAAAPVARLAGQAGLGALSGAGGYLGGLIAPEGHKAAGEFIGSLAGGLGSLGATAGAHKLGLNAEGLADALPVTRGLQERAAAQQLRSAAPEAAEQLAQSAPKAPVAVEPNASATDRAIAGLQNSPRTVSQATNSPELARIEEALTTTGKGRPLDQVRQQQADARTAAANAIGGDQNVPREALSDYLRQARASEEQDAASASAVAGQSRESAARAPLMGDKNADTSLEGAPNQAVAGERIRNEVAAGDAQRKEAASALYKALDDRNPQMEMTPLRATAERMSADMRDSGAATDPELSRAVSPFLSRFNALADDKSANWRKVQTLRSSLTSSIRDSEATTFGRPNATSRYLSQLRDGLDTSIDTAVDRHVAANPVAWNSDLAAQAKLWQQAKSADERERIVSGGGRENVPENTLGRDEQSLGTGNVSATSGTERTAGRQQSNTGRSGGLEEDRPDAPSIWNESDLATYRGANQAHRERLADYWNDTLKPVLAKGANNDWTKTPESVASTLLPGGDRASQVAKRIKTVAKDRPDVERAYGQVIGENLRSSILGADGVSVNRAKLAAWRNRQAGLLREYPQLDRKLRDMDGAQAMVDSTVARQQEVAKAWQDKTLTSLLGGDDPSVAMERVLRMDPRNADAFMARIGKDAPARAAARRVAADVLVDQMRKAGGDDLKLNSVVQSLRSPARRATYRAVFGPDGERVMRALADDLQSSNTGALAARSLGNSATASRLKAAEQLNAPQTWLGGFVREALGRPVPAGVSVALAASHVGAPLIPVLGAVKAMGERVVRSRQEQAQQVLADLMADPAAARRALRKYRPGEGDARRFGRDVIKAVMRAGRQSTVPTGDQ